MKAALLTLWISIATSGCLVVDLLHGQSAANDAGADTGVDAGPGNRAVDHCEDEGIYVIPDTERFIPIDTREFDAESQANCGGQRAEGNDGFLAIDVNAGEKWHFHIRGSGEFTNSANSYIYMLPELEAGGCDYRDCTPATSSDFCGDDDESDEHFAFVAPNSGRWYLAIDDRNEGGATYTLDAFRINCPDGEMVHGEACDEGADTADCDGECRLKMSGDPSEERSTFGTLLEANRVIVPGDNNINISGQIGDACYPDFFTFEVLTDSTDLTVISTTSGFTPCFDETTTQFSFDLLNAAQEDVPATSNAAGDCATLTANDLAAGFYTVLVVPNADLEPPGQQYFFELELSP